MTASDHANVLIRSQLRTASRQDEEHQHPHQGNADDQEDTNENEAGQQAFAELETKEVWDGDHSLNIGRLGYSL